MTMPPNTIYELEAQASYDRRDEIEEAAKWCIENYPHKLMFLNQIRHLLTSEERHFRSLNINLFGDIKKLTTLDLISPSQSLRLLECFKRQTSEMNLWKAKKLSDMRRIEMAAELKKLTAAINKN